MYAEQVAQREQAKGWEINDNPELVRVDSHSELGL